jgi:hypothetical protein
MSENERHMVYLIGGEKKTRDFYVWEVYPNHQIFAFAIRGKNAELIAAAADAELMSHNYFIAGETECDVFDKNGNLVGKTPRRHIDYELIAQDVAKMLHKDRVKILIR